MPYKSVAHSTYDRVSRAKEHGASGPSPQLAAQRAVQDQVMEERHAGWDLSAKDHHMKYERSHFAVVMSSADYRTNYDLIDWSA